MNKNIRAIELGFREMGYISIPEEYINKLTLNNVEIGYTHNSEGKLQREANANEVYLEIRSEDTIFYFRDTNCWLGEDNMDLLDILDFDDVTHIVIRYVDNTKEEYMVACDEVEDDFNGSQWAWLNDKDGVIGIVVTITEDGFNKYVLEEEDGAHDL